MARFTFDIYYYLLFVISIMKLLNTMLSKNIVWSFFILLAVKGMLSQGASVPNSNVQLEANRPQINLTTLLSRGNDNSSFILYPTYSFEVKSFELDLGDVKNGVFFSMETSCSSIPIWDKICSDDASNCQIAGLNIKNAESTMEILSQTLFSLSRICELPNYPSSINSINRCHKGMSWTTSEGLNKQYSFLDSMMEGYHKAMVREKCFIISGPVAITTAIGVL